MTIGCPEVQSKYLQYSALIIAHHKCKHVFTCVCVPQETMTDPVHHVEDVSKLKDSGEIKQAYIGLKDTNRYSPLFLHLFLRLNLSPPLLYPQLHWCLCVFLEVCVGFLGSVCVCV